MNANFFLIAAYAVAWGFVLIYLLTLSIRIKEVRRELEIVKKSKEK